MDLNFEGVKDGEKIKDISTYLLMSSSSKGFSRVEYIRLCMYSLYVCIKACFTS